MSSEIIAELRIDITNGNATGSEIVEFIERIIDYKIQQFSDEMDLNNYRLEDHLREYIGSGVLTIVARD